MELFVLQNTLYIMYVAGLSSEAGCRRNSTSTLYSAAGYFLCIEDKKCVIYWNPKPLSWQRPRFFSPLPIAYYRHDYWPLNCKQCKPNRQKSRCFSLASESLVPLYGMNKLIKHHKMSKRKLSFPDQSSIAKWLILVKENKCIFETLSVQLSDDIKLKS